MKLFFLILALLLMSSACSQKPRSDESSYTQASDATKPAATPTPVPPEPPKVSIQNGVEIEYKVREPKHVLDRYGFVKDLQAADYVAWRMDAGGVFGQMVAEFDRSPERHYMELLLTVTNKSEAQKRIDISNVFLENGPDRLLPWECLPGNAIETYAELVRFIGLSAEPPTGNTMVTFNTEQDNKWRGAFYTSLKSGQKAWADFIFLVPKSLHATKLHFGPKAWEPMDVSL